MAHGAAVDITEWLRRLDAPERRLEPAPLADLDCAMLTPGTLTQIRGELWSLRATRPEVDRAVMLIDRHLAERDRRVVTFEKGD
jgi:hypothetical protein